MQTQGGAKWEKNDGHGLALDTSSCRTLVEPFRPTQAIGHFETFLAENQHFFKSCDKILVVQIPTPQSGPMLIFVQKSLEVAILFLKNIVIFSGIIFENNIVGLT